MSSKRILFVLTSQEQLGSTGHKTGAFLSEITHAYDEFLLAGYTVEMASPEGGMVPLDGVVMDDPVNAVWMNDDEFETKIEKTFKVADVRAADYEAVYFVGGHGAMFDFPDNADIQALVREIYTNDGVVGAVCHGVAALVNVKLEDGSYLVADHEVASFTNAEEQTVGMEQAVPFMLETRLQERGAHHTTAPQFASHVVKSGRIVTGQNPASSFGVAKAMIEVLDFVHEGRNVPDQNWCEWQDPHLDQHQGLNRY